jgi:hypothetical protein
MGGDTESGLGHCVWEVEGIQKFLDVAKCIRNFF